MSDFNLNQDAEAAEDHEVAGISLEVSDLPSEATMSLNVGLVARLLKRLEEAEEEASQDPASALITFILEHANGPDGFDPVYLMETWNEGNFEALRREWPELPEEVYIGADPLHEKTRPQLVTKVVTADGKKVAVGYAILSKRLEQKPNQFEVAFKEMSRALDWMQERGKVPAKYLGLNLAEALTEMYREALDKLDQATVRSNRRDAIWGPMHDLAVAKGYDHVEYAVQAAPQCHCDCRGARQVAQNDGTHLPCECVAAANEPTQGRKLHLVWNKPRNECVGFIDKPDAIHAATGEEPEGFESTLAIAWLDIYGEDGPLHMETVLVEEKGDEGK